MLFFILLVNVAPIFCKDYTLTSRIQAETSIRKCTTDIKDQPALTYFDSPGRAELSRLILKSGQIDFTDTRIKYDDCPRNYIDSNRQGSKLCDQLPIYEKGENIRLTDRLSIAKSVADLAIPSTRISAQDRETDNIILDICSDIQKELYKCYHGSEYSKTEATRNIESTLRPYLINLESKIPTSGYIKGTDRPSASDLAIFDLYSSTSPGLISKIDLSRYPRLVKLCQTVRQYPTIKTYCEERGF